MRVLVTGGSGFVGQHLIRALLEGGGAEVVAGSYSGEPPAPGGLSADEIARVRWEPLDVTSTPSVEAALSAAEPACVYHLAGQASVGASFANPLLTWEVNATGTLRLLEGVRARAASARVLVISSAEVYGAVDPARLPVREGEPLRPTTPYGASKAAAEMAALQAAAAGLDVVVARSFNHTGPGQDTRFALPSMAQQLARMSDRGAERVLRVGNLEARRDMLDVRDVARAYLTLMERGERGEAYNVCSGAARSLLGLVEEMVELSGTGARIEVDPERVRPVDIPLLVGDPGRLRALGWTPRIELRRTLTELLEASRHG